MKASSLVCKGCGATLPARGALRLRPLLRAARGRLRRRVDDAGDARRASTPGRERCGATPTSCRSRRRPSGLPVGMLAARSGADRLAEALGLELRAVRQDRDVEPDPLVQGPGGRGRGRQGRRARLRGAGLRVDRQPGRRHGRRRRGARACRPTSSSPPTSSARRSSPPPPTARTVFAVDGSYDDVNRLCSELAYERPWAFVNVNMRAYYSEGSKTIALETAEQLGWRAPDRVVAPIASGLALHQDPAGLRARAERPG